MTGGLVFLAYAGTLGRRALATPTHPAPPPTAKANNNRVPAGRLTAGTLTLSLELRGTVWNAGGSPGSTISLFAFAETGMPPSIPGPLIRVPAGTEIRLRLHNRLDRRAVVHGLHDHNSTADSVVLAAGEARTVSFRAFTPGTQLYWGRTTPGSRIIGRHEDSQLLGAFIVDPLGTRPRAAERVMVISAFDDTVPAAQYPAGHFQIFAINGLSWPHTERLQYTRGDTIQWRVINATDHFHPMHLHGFFFSVESRGSALRDTVYTPAERREAVTESMRSATAVRLSWVASRSGNWLYHCHMISHMETALRFNTPVGTRLKHEAAPHARVEDVMSGLVIAITVGEPPDWDKTRDEGEASASPRRRLRLFVTERPGEGGGAPALSYVLQEGIQSPAADSALRPGATLVLHQNEPTEIIVTNLARRATAVHWHGLELESYFDGVAGWSGTKGRRAPLIAAGDSFVVRITPPRAGTFIYHTHADETTQLRGGLFGAFIVLPKGATQRDTTERLLIITEAGLDQPDLPAGARRIEPTVALRAGITHRLRFLIIPAVDPIQVRLLRDTMVVHWRAVAKDGADLPATQAIESPALVLFGAGETLDVEVLEERPGQLTLEMTRVGTNIAPFRIPVIVR